MRELAMKWSAAARALVLIATAIGVWAIFGHDAAVDRALAQRAQPARPRPSGVVMAPWRTWQPGTPATAVSTTGKTYYVSPKGSDSNSGLSLATAFATPQKAASVVQAGDTVLIAAGLYRGGINMTNYASGTAGKPITFGSLGDGPVVIDGSTPVTGWTPVSGSVWQATASFTPIAVVVNNVPLKQVTSQSAVTSGSGNWYRSGKTIVADFGSSTPSTADIVVPNSDGAQTVVYFYGNNYLTFNGLTVRGSGAAGIWGYGSNITVSHCDLEFNGKAGVNFMAMQGNANANNQVLYSRVHDNVLLNWPRGNNGFASAGGGWSGGLAFSESLNAVARGNVVYDNGGEGIISYGSGGGATTGGTLFEQNVAFDNWSVNMYFDNQPNDIARQNILFDHPMDTSTWLKPPSAGYPWNQLYKFSVCLMIADEQGSSGGTGGYAHLANTRIYDNLIVGCRIGIRDYSEGLLASAQHGLKNTLIANNTIILPVHPLPPGSSTYTAGIQLQDNGGNNANSRIVNNLIVGFTRDEPVIWSMRRGPLAGIDFSHNVYYNPATPRTLWMGNSFVDKLDLAGWQARLQGDVASRFENPMLAGWSRIAAGDAAAGLDYRDAEPAPGSPLKGSAAALTAQFSSNLAGKPRRGRWDIGAF